MRNEWADAKREKIFAIESAEIITGSNQKQPRGLTVTSGLCICEDEDGAGVGQRLSEIEVRVVDENWACEIRADTTSPVMLFGQYFRSLLISARERKEEREREGKRKIDSSELENRFVATASFGMDQQRVRLNLVAVPRPVTAQRNIPLNKLPRPTDDIEGRPGAETRAKVFYWERDDLWSVTRAFPLAVCEKSQRRIRIQRIKYSGERESRQGRPETASWCREEDEEW